MISVNIFIMCYNEQHIIEKTIEHYKNYLPQCTIHIIDNFSTDSSILIAKRLGCNIIPVNTGRKMNVNAMNVIKNHLYRSFVKDGWVIMVDMNEWLCVTEKDLVKEQKNKVSILTVEGYDIIGDSQLSNLSDIDLLSLNKCVYNKKQDKNVCFYVPLIKKVKFGANDNATVFDGNIKYSTKIYKLKHMSYLGKDYCLEKYKKRFERTTYLRKDGSDIYCDYENEVIEKFKYLYENFFIFNEYVDNELVGDAQIIERVVNHEEIVENNTYINYDDSNKLDIYDDLNASSYFIKEVEQINIEDKLEEINNMDKDISETILFEEKENL